MNIKKGYCNYCKKKLRKIREDKIYKDWQRKYHKTCLKKKEEDDCFKELIKNYKKTGEII